MLNDYGIETQKLFLEMMLHDPESFVRVQNIYNPENFDRSIKAAAEFVKQHFEDHGSLPILAQVSASTGVRLNEIPELPDGSLTWFMTEFEKFTQRQELERAILKSADLLEKGEFAPVEKLIKDAVQISLQKDMGTDYFDDPKGRNDKYFNSGGQVSTGWPSLDKILYGGFSRGELNIFAGGSGSGKSLVMMNIALSWLEQGLSGVYVSLELSEELVGLRTDAMLSNMSTKEIRKDLDTATMKVRMFSGYIDEVISTYTNLNYIQKKDCKKLSLFIIPDTTGHPNVTINFTPMPVNKINKVVLGAFKQKLYEADLKINEKQPNHTIFSKSLLSIGPKSSTYLQHYCIMQYLN